MDWVGFVISALALLFLFFRNAMKKNEPVIKGEVKEEEPEEIPLHEFLKEVERRERVQEEKVAPPKPLVPQMLKRKRDSLELRHLVSPLKNEHIKSKTENRHLVSPLGTRKVKTEIEPGSGSVEGRVAEKSLAKVILDELKHPKNMLIYYEIFGKPKGL